MSERIGPWRRRAWIAGILAGLAHAAAAEPCRLDEAQAMLAARRTAEARLLFEECARAGTNDPATASALGRFYLSQRDDKRAVDWLERASALDPSSSETELWLGRAYGSAALHASVVRQPFLARKVERAFERAVELDPENLAARLSLVEYALRAPGFLGGSSSKALAQAQEIRRRDPVKGHRAFGMIAEHEKRYADAAQEYDAAMQESPGAPDPVHWRADLAIRRKDYRTAFALFQILAQDGRDGEALYDIGELAALSGRELQIGIESLKRYLARQPTAEEPSLAQAHLRLAAIYERQKDREAARQEYSTALALDPMLTEARQALAKR